MQRHAEKIAPIPRIWQLKLRNPRCYNRYALASSRCPHTVKCQFFTLPDVLMSGLAVSLP